VESSFGVESPSFVALRAVLSLCAIGLLGVLALRWVVLVRYAGPDAQPLRDAVTDRLQGVIDGLGLVAVAATIARLIAQHAAVFGSEAVISVGTLGTLLFKARWGRSWWLAITAAILITWLAPRLRARSRVVWIACAVAIVLFAASQPWSGHPAAAPQPWLAISTQLLHVIGAGGWVGSLALLTVVAIPAARSLSLGAENDAAEMRVAAMVRAFSPTALGFAALLGITGVWTAWNNLGGVTPLWQSVYGQTLLIKLGLLSIAAGTGAYNWRRVLPALGQPQASARLRRSSLLELGAAVLVVIVTAVLVATPMPGE
jgi:putative copper export protein